MDIIIEHPKKQVMRLNEQFFQISKVSRILKRFFNLQKSVDNG